MPLVQVDSTLKGIPWQIIFTFIAVFIKHWVIVKMHIATADAHFLTLSNAFSVNNSRDTIGYMIV